MKIFQRFQPHFLQLYYRLIKVRPVSGILKRISNISLVFRLERNKLYISDLPRATRLLKIAKSLEVSLTWDIFVTFLRSNSELDQEFVAYLICGECNFFVEFGAFDGVIASNTFLLERDF